MKTRFYQKLSVLAVSAFVFLCISNLSAQDSPQPTNIVTNPGFEEGVNGWGAGPEALSDKVFHSGLHSISIKCTGAGKFTHITQTLPLPPGGSKVDCSVWVKTSTPKVKYQIYCDITAAEEGDDAKYFSGPSTGILKNGDTEWKEVKLSFIFPADSYDKDGNLLKMAGVYLRLATNDKTAGDIWFDDVSVVVTPPASSEKQGK